MDWIDRVSLYKSVQSILDKNKDYLHYFIFEQFESSFWSNLSKLLKLNIAILTGIEEKFLINSYNMEIDKLEFNEVYIENLNRFKLENDFINEKNLSKLESFTETIGKSKDEYYAFNSLINLLSDINNSIINQPQTNEGYIHNGRLVIGHFTWNKVFLSHAFDDKLYTLSLFIFMLKKGIFLYVDWIFSPNFENGVDIKNNLSKHLSESRQLLFLRTVNSEFSIRGSGNIRGWCSWELGTFYTLNKMQSDDKYYIELYKGKNKQRNNKQLDGIKPLKAIFYGRLK
jgi:hypothetical protein